MFDSMERLKNHCELLLTDPAEYADKICELFDYWMNDVDGNIEVRPFASYVSSYFTHHMRSCTKGNCMYHMASIYHDGKSLSVRAFISGKNIVWVIFLRLRIYVTFSKKMFINR